MPQETPFSVVTGRLLDAWLQTRPDDRASAAQVYGDVLSLLSVKMRLTVFQIEGPDPLKWYMKAIRHSGFASRILNINQIFADCHIGDFKDRGYMEQSVIPRLLSVTDNQQPVIEHVKTKLFGVNLAYDRILLPQKNTQQPEWVISSSYARFLLNPPQNQGELDISDEAVVQLLIEGGTAKEIAATLNMSYRTVEHRLERMKQRFGARNNVHLAAMLIATQLDRLPVEPEERS